MQKPKTSLEKQRRENSIKQRNKILRSRKRKRQKLILRFCMFCFLIIILALGVQKIKSYKSTKVFTEARQAQSLTIKTKVNEVKMQEKKKEQARIAALEARKENAVDPAKSVGNTEQTEEKIVNLTFDDGPSANTQEVLDILDEYEVKATFFVTGLNEEYFYLIKEAYDRGHTIGLHTYSHNYSAVYASEAAYYEDLKKIGNLVESQIGYVPCFIRFPGGASNTVSRKYTQGIMSALTRSVLEKGYQYYDWNVSSGDGGNVDTQTLIQESIGASANNLNILFHDAKGKATTVAGLPQIIEHYLEEGYEFRALDRDSYAPHHKANN